MTKCSSAPLSLYITNSIVISGVNESHYHYITKHHYLWCERTFSGDWRNDDVGIVVGFIVFEQSTKLAWEYDLN